MVKISDTENQAKLNNIMVYDNPKRVCYFA